MKLRTATRKALLAIGALTVFFFVLGIPSPANATEPTFTAQHDGTASGSCQGGVVWNFHNYDKEVVNTITVTIDGVVRWQDLDFKSSDEGQILTDMTLPHSWSVVVNAPGTVYDKNLSGEYGPCVEPTTTIAETTTVPESTTTIGETTTVPTTIPEFTIPTTIVDTTTTIAPNIGTPQGPTLPKTGTETTVTLFLAAFLVAFGVVTMALRR